MTSGKIIKLLGILILLGGIVVIYLSRNKVTHFTTNQLSPKISSNIDLGKVKYTQSNLEELAKKTGIIDHGVYVWGNSSGISKAIEVNSVRLAITNESQSFYPLKAEINGQTKNVLSFGQEVSGKNLIIYYYIDEDYISEMEGQEGLHQILNFSLVAAMLRMSASNEENAAAKKIDSNKGQLDNQQILSLVDKHPVFK